MPHKDGVDACRQIMELLPDARGLTASTEEDAVAAGATGYLQKYSGPEELAEAIREVAQGRLRIPDKSIRRAFALGRSQPRPHGQNQSPPKSEYCVFNWSDKLLGTHPLNSFPLRSSLVRLARLPNSGGISPLNWFPLRASHDRLPRLPNSGGISPLNWFSVSHSFVRLARLPNSGGISPLNWFRWRSSSVTRPLPSVVTPSHSLIGTSLSQLLFLLQFGPPVAL